MTRLDRGRRALEDRLRSASRRCETGHAGVVSEGVAIGSTDIRVIYDGGCPLCRAFVRGLRPHNSATPLVLVDARADPEQRRALSDRGIDLEEGFAVIARDTCRTGADVAHALAKLHVGTGLADRLAVWSFGTHGRAALTYPLFKACRRLLLFAMGRKPL